MTKAASPFVGADHYKFADAGLFFGRGEDRDRLIDMVEANRVSVLYAYSGYGKTSLLQAGLVPALEARGRPVAIVRPLENPWHETCRALQHRAFPDPVDEAERLEEAALDVLGPGWRNRSLGELMRTFKEAHAHRPDLRRHFREHDRANPYNRPCMVGLLLFLGGSASRFLRYVGRIDPEVPMRREEATKAANARRIRPTAALRDPPLGEIHAALCSTRAEEVLSSARQDYPEAEAARLFRSLDGLGEEPVIVVDQAEQLFTHFGAGRRGSVDLRDAFIGALQALASSPPQTTPGLGIVLSLRQEYLASVVERGRAGLTRIWPAARPFSTHQGYQLGPLTAKAARGVADDVLALKGVETVDSLQKRIDALIDDLCEAGDEIEPVHFSLVFSELWDAAADEKNDETVSSSPTAADLLRVFYDLQAKVQIRGRAEGGPRSAAAGATSSIGSILLDRRIDNALSSIEPGSIDEFEMFSIYNMLHNGDGTRIVRDRKDLASQPPHDPVRRDAVIDTLRRARIVRVTKEREDRELVDLTHERLIAHLDRRRLRAFESSRGDRTGTRGEPSVDFGKLESTLRSLARDIDMNAEREIDAVRWYASHFVEAWRDAERSMDGVPDTEETNGRRMPKGWGEIARRMLVAEIRGAGAPDAGWLRTWSELACEFGRADRVAYSSPEQVRRNLVRALLVLDGPDLRRLLDGVLRNDDDMEGRQ